jgi:5-methylcytosine-specific restriction endonuclease McrA
MSQPTKTLVLNTSYVPLAVVPLQRAVILVLLERADVVETDGSYLHSPSRAVEVPTVIKLREFVRVPFTRRLPITRRNVLARDDHVCGYCGGRADTIDHVVPRAQGGQHVWTNVAAACRSCNGRKGAQTPAQAGMPLRVKPFEPSGQGALVVLVGTVEAAWEPYLATA